MRTGFTERQAERRTDEISDLAASAKHKLTIIREKVTDSSEVADAVDEALEAVGKVELAAEVVIERRTR